MVSYFHYFKKIIDSHCGFDVCYFSQKAEIATVSLSFICMKKQVLWGSNAKKSNLVHFRYVTIMTRTFLMTKTLPAIKGLEQGTGQRRNTCKKKTHHNKLVLVSRTMSQRKHKLGG